MKHETIQDEQPSMAPHKLMCASDVRELFGGVSKMTLHRWQRDPDLGFPQPLFISRRRFWREAELIEFIERQPRELN